MEWWREKIDELDRQLVELLNQRSRYAMKIGELKRQAGLEVYQPHREAEVIKNAIASNHGPLGNDAVQRLFERIIDESRRVERLASEEQDGSPENREQSNLE